MKLLNAAKLEVDRLNDQLNSNIITNFDNITTEEKIDVVNTVVELVTINRKSRNSAVIKITNKFTGEQRELLCNTWKCEILDMKVHTRPTLSYIK